MYDLDWSQHQKMSSLDLVKLVGWLVGFLTSSSTTRLYRGRAPRQSVWQFYVRPHMRQSWETMTSVSAGHIILTPTQPVGSGRPQRESNPGLPHQESRALPLSYRAPRYSNGARRRKETRFPYLYYLNIPKHLLREGRGGGGRLRRFSAI